MKIVVGIDNKCDVTIASLLQRLRFSDAEIDITHVISPAAWAPTGIYGGIPEAPYSYSDYQEVEAQEKEAAQTMLSTASPHFITPDEKECLTSVCLGNPTDMLLEHADSNDVDMIAVNAAHQNPLLAFLTGSVARGLVIGAHQSILLARGNATKRDMIPHPLRVVLATDHSPYMDRCIDRFLGFLPQGIQHLTVLTIFPEAELKAARSHLHHLKVNPVEAMQHELTQRNEKLIERLKERLSPFGTTFSSWVSGELVNDAISRAMEETEADLLILGAQGHSLLKRLTLGSISFHQAMAAPYSVLMLREG